MKILLMMFSLLSSYAFAGDIFDQIENKKPSPEASGHKKEGKLFDDEMKDTVKPIGVKNRDGYYVFVSAKTESRHFFKPFDGAYTHVPVSRDVDDMGFNNLHEDYQPFVFDKKPKLNIGLGIGKRSGDWDVNLSIFAPRKESYRFSSEARYEDLRERNELSYSAITTSFGLDYRVEIAHKVIADMSISYRVFDEIRVGLSPSFDVFQIAMDGKRSDCLRSKPSYNWDTAGPIYKYDAKNEGANHEQCMSDGSFASSSTSTSLSLSIPFSYRFYLGSFFAEPGLSYRFFDSLKNNNAIDYSLKFGGSI